MCLWVCFLCLGYNCCVTELRGSLLPVLNPLFPPFSLSKACSERRINAKLLSGLVSFKIYSLSWWQVSSGNTKFGSAPGCLHLQPSVILDKWQIIPFMMLFSWHALFWTCMEDVYRNLTIRFRQTIFALHLKRGELFCTNTFLILKYLEVCIDQASHPWKEVLFSLDHDNWPMQIAQQAAVLSWVLWLLWLS